MEGDQRKERQMKKLETAERYSWYILRSMEYKIDMLEKAIIEAQASGITSDRNGMLAHCEQAIVEYRLAYDALKKVGFK